MQTAVWQRSGMREGRDGVAISVIGPIHGKSAGFERSNRILALALALFLSIFHSTPREKGLHKHCGCLF